MKAAILCAATAALLSRAPSAQETVAVKAGSVVTLAGPTIADAVILIQNGRIAKVAKASELEVPWDAKVIDAKDKTVLPTWVLAHAPAGMRGGNEQMQNVPYVTVADAVDPSAPFFEDCLRGGVGTVNVLPGNMTLIGGIGLVVKPYGRSVEDMAVQTRSGLKMSLSSQGARLAQVRKLRRALEDVREYLADFDRRKKEFEAEKKAGAVPADKEWTEDHDRTKKPVIDLLAKKLKGFLYVPSAAEVGEALRLSQELDLVLVLGPNVHKAALELQKLKTPVVLDEVVEYWETDEDSDKEKLVCTAKVLFDHGVPFALSIGERGATSQPWWQLATCVRNGVDRRTALEALTVVPARILGMEDQVGTIAEGKLANLQILTGDPLQATTWVDMVLLQGEVVYERSKDPRLQYLFGKDQKDKGAPAAGPEKRGG
jgi:imidazolonepropionase-like amidohydrolase